MIRRIVLILTVAASSGCFDFDAAYTQFCDGGRCSDGGSGTGGGAAVGGGGGSTGGGGGSLGGGTGGTGGSIGGGAGGSMGGGAGGSMGGGGGSLGGGGGSTGGGGGSTGGGGGTVDGGCQQFLCPEIDWMSSRSSVHYVVAPGLMTESFNRFFVFGSFEANAAGSNNFTHFEYRFEDGGVRTIPRFLDNRVETRQLRGVTMDDYVVTYRTAAKRYENTLESTFGACTLGAGMTDPWHWALAPVSPDELYLVGYPMSICHWTRAGGLVATVDPATHPTVYLEDVYRAPSGDLYAVGGDYVSSSATGVIFREDGTPVSTAPTLVDDYYGDGFSSIDGTGNLVYVLGRSNAAQQGEIHQLQADGGFARVYTAPFRLNRLDVMPTGEVWAVGQSSTRVVYFDGGTWNHFALPTTQFRSTVRWENVNGTDEGIILTGYETQPDGGNTAVVNTYRRFGK